MRTRVLTAFFAVASIWIVIDQLVKAWVRNSLSIGQSNPLPWPGVFEIQLTYNQGIAFGMLAGKGVLMTPIALFIAAFAGYQIWRKPEETRWLRFAFALLAAGAIGNLIDRVVAGKVTDMFWFRAINFPVFNVADACITVATIMLMIGWWNEAKVQSAIKNETSAAQVE